MKQPLTPKKAQDIIGIYKITSPNGKIYIGQSINIPKRFNTYKTLNCKPQIMLYRSLVKYGYDSHRFEVLTTCLEGELNRYERYFQDVYFGINPKKSLNCKLTTTDTRSGKFSLETRTKISIAHKGKKLSPETIAKLKNRVVSNETKLKQKIARIGRKLSVEHKLNISKSGSGRVVTPETRAKIGAANKGRKPGCYGKKYSKEYCLWRSQNSYQAKQVIDTNTGIIYRSGKEAAKHCNIVYSTLNQYLRGARINITSLKYYNNEA